MRQSLYVRSYHLKKKEYRKKEKYFFIGPKRLVFKVTNYSVFLIFYFIVFFFFGLIVLVFFLVRKDFGYGISLFMMALMLLLVVRSTIKNKRKKVWFDKSQNAFKLIDRNFGNTPGRISLINEIYIVKAKYYLSHYQVNIRYNSSEFYNICTEEEYGKAHENAEIIANYLHHKLKDYTKYNEEVAT